jgi:hypothetical protein
MFRRKEEIRMPYFVAKRPISVMGLPNAQFHYRVFSEEEIETIGPEWDWASSACDTREEAERQADDLFWDSIE